MLQNLKWQKYKAVLLFVLLIPCWIIAWHGVGDIGMYYAVAGYAKHMEFEKIYGINAGVGHFFYGPLSLVLFGWMPSFSYEAVRWIWILINTVAYYFFWKGMYQLFPFLAKRETSWLWILIWIVSIKSIHATFQSHNVQLVIAACLLAGEFYRRSASGSTRFFSSWASVVCAVVKVFPSFMVLYSVLRGDGKVGRGIVVAGLAAVFLPFLYFGAGNAVHLYDVFVHNLGNFHDYAPLTKDAVTLSLASGLATWFSPFIGMEGAAVVHRLLMLAIGSSYFYYVWRTRERRDERFETHLFSLGMALMALLNSTTRPDYFVFFVPAFASIAEVCQKQKPSLWCVSGITVSVFLINLISEWTLGSRELGHQLELYRLPVVGMVTLCVTVCGAVLYKNGKSSDTLISP